MVEGIDRSKERGRRTRRGRGAAAAAAVALLMGLPACGGDAPESAPDGASASATTQSSSGGQPHSHEDGEDHAHGEGGHTHAAADTLAGVTLEPASSAGWTGSATVLAVGDSVRILVSVEDAPGGSRHAAVLLAGSCDEPGSELASLTPVAAGSSGKGSSQTTLPTDRLDGHGHGALRVSAADGSSGACAAVHLTASGHEHG